MPISLRARGREDRHTLAPFSAPSPGLGWGAPGTPGSLCISSTGAEPATCQSPSSPSCPGQGAAPGPNPGCAPLPTSWGRGAAPAVHSQRQTLQAQLCPQQLLLPSVPPALKWVSPSQPPGERTASVRAARSQGARPQDLSSERARVGAGFRELGALPGPCATVERDGGAGGWPPARQNSSLSAAAPSSRGVGG